MFTFCGFTLHVVYPLNFVCVAKVLTSYNCCTFTTGTTSKVSFQYVDHSKINDLLYLVEGEWSHVSKGSFAPVQYAIY